MEQSNIRWGEIVGGILIVGCSTALVISLWAQISSIPVLKFLIFTTVTAALFGVGFYTEHRWKLPTTSRGILTIAVLLVPQLSGNRRGFRQRTAPPGALVISSNIAPALSCVWSICGLVIRPSWPRSCSRRECAHFISGSIAHPPLCRQFPGFAIRARRFPVLLRRHGVDDAARVGRRRD
jgi:hypothetical protein